MYQAAQNRDQVIPYRRCGASGLMLPAVSLGLWHNFGDTAPYENMRALCRTAFDHGITHFDLANNYGPEPGAAGSHPDQCRTGTDEIDFLQIADAQSTATLLYG